MSVETGFAIGAAIMVVGSIGIAAWFTYLFKRDHEHKTPKHS